MLGRSTLFIPEAMMERIDTHRGELSRVEFLEFCIGTTVSDELRREERRGGYPLRRPEKEEYRPEPTVPRRVAEEYVARKEFEDLVQSVRELVTRRQPAAETISKEEFEDLKQSVRGLATLRKPAAEAAAREEVEDLKQSIRELVMLREATEEAVTKDEFDDFKHNIKELQKSFIDFFVTYGLEFGGSIPEEEQEKFKQNAKRLLEL